MLKNSIGNRVKFARKRARLDCRKCEEKTPHVYNEPRLIVICSRCGTASRRRPPLTRRDVRP
jgi:ribosomal protein S27E